MDKTLTTLPGWNQLALKKWILKNSETSIG